MGEVVVGENPGLAGVVRNPSSSHRICQRGEARAVDEGG
jgi:hypothetical protein